MDNRTLVLHLLQCQNVYAGTSPLS
uniref:Uncharacterized protein n=1 Tax=Anguilla anguilla TaxID=7936 RepID=A0A0E9SUV0_ANGAN